MAQLKVFCFYVCWSGQGEEQNMKKLVAGSYKFAQKCGGIQKQL